MGDFKKGPEGSRTDRVIKGINNEGVDPKTGLFGKTRNVFLLFEFICKLYRDNSKSLDAYFEESTAQPLRDYETFVRDWVKPQGSSEKEIAEILAASNPQKVEAFNKLVKVYNLDRERIRKERDYKAIEKFRQAVEILF